MSEHAPRHPRPLYRRVLMIAGKVLAGLVLFAIGAVALVLLAATTRPGERFVVKEVNRALANSFRGTVTVEGFRDLAFVGVDDAKVLVRDPEGRVVLVANGLTAHVAVGPVLRALVSGRDLPIVLTASRIRDVEAILVLGPDGQPTIMHAFDPRHPSPPSAPSSRGIRLDIHHARIDRIWAHGAMASFDALDAVVSHLNAAIAYDPSTLTADVQPFDLDARGLLPDARSLAGKIAAHLDMPSTGDRRANASFDGGSGDVGVTLRATMQGDRVDATAKALAGGGTIDLEANGAIGEAKSIEATIAIDDVDPRRIVASAPSIAVRAHAQLKARIDASGAISGNAELRTEPMLFDSETIPPIVATSQFTDSRAVGHAHVAEPGAPADIDFAFEQRGKKRSVEVQAHALAGDLTRVDILRDRGVQGAADVYASGHADLTRKTLNAEANAQLAGLRVGDDSVQLSVVHAAVHGSFQAPSVDATIEATNSTVLGRAIDQIRANATGSTQRLTVTTFARSQGLDLHAGAKIRLGDGVTADDVVVDATRGAIRAAAEVDHVRVAGDTIRVAGLNVTGMGSPITGRAELSRDAIAVRVDAPQIDSERLSTLLGRENVKLRGTTRIDADIRATRQAASGQVDAELHSVGFDDAGPGDVRLSLSLNGRHANGEMDLSLEKSHATIRLSDVIVGGPPVELSSWQHVTGTVDVDSNVDLATLAKVAPKGMLPFEQMAGLLTLKAHLARDRASATPNANVTVSTTGLALVTRAPDNEGAADLDSPDQAQPPKLAWQTRGVDIHFTTSLDGASKRLAFDGGLTDKDGDVADLKLETVAPIGVHEGSAKEAMEHAPITLHAQIPNRDLTRLPPVLRPAALRGHVSATLDVKGRVDDPRVDLHAETSGLQPMKSESAIALDGNLDASYDGRVAEAKVQASRAQRPDDIVIDAKAVVDAREMDFVNAPNTTPSWDAKASVKLDRFPVEVVPQVAARHVAGLASGTVVLDGLHRDATLDTDLQFSKTKLGRVVFEAGSVRARIDRDKLDVSTRFEKSGSSLAATLKGKTRWGAALAPSLEEGAPVDGTLQAHAFPAAALMPFVAGAVHQLDGQIDADASIHVQPDFKNGTANGDVVFSKGRLDLPAVGGSLHDIGARVSIRPWGTLRVDDIVASGVEGKLKASASAQLDGMRLQQAKLALDIAHGDRMPFTLGGVSLGEASGHVEANAQMSPDQGTLNVGVNIPKFELDLPQSSGHAVQSLDSANDVVIGMREANGKFVPLPLHEPEKPGSPDAMKVRVVVDLGNEVWIKRDTSLAFRVTGKPVLDLGEAAQIHGTVHVTSGKLEVFGKRFDIQSGSTVSFTGDPNDPQLVVTATYDAPDKTKIYADVVGTLKHLDVKLRSGSGQTQDELLSVLLFGSEEGIGGTPPPSEQPDSTQRAAGLAGGVVTQGINKALSGITSLDISTRLDTSDAANPKPEVEVRVSNSVVTRVTVNTGMPAPGESPDRTLLSIDWAFKPRWILESTVGDAGSTFFDLLWHHRY